MCFERVEKGKKKFFYCLFVKVLYWDTGTEFCLRFNFIDYIFYFLKCYLFEGVGGVFGIYLVDVLVMWFSVLVGSSY